MQEDDNKPKLTILSGGKDETRKRTGKTPQGLTQKQEAFAQAMAKGLSLSDCYRAAYDTGTMKANVVNNEASKLAARRDITDRVEAIIAENTRKNSMFTARQREKNSDRIWARVWDMLDDPITPPAVKATLLSLGAKAAGMLTDKVEIENKHADSGALEKELLERLQRLSKAG